MSKGLELLKQFNEDAKDWGWQSHQGRLPDRVSQSSRDYHNSYNELLEYIQNLESTAKQHEHTIATLHSTIKAVCGVQ